MEVVDHKRVLTVPADKSCIIKDRATGQAVMVVIRNFVGDENLLSYIDSIIAASLDFRRSTRVSVISFQCIPALILVVA